MFGVNGYEFLILLMVAVIVIGPTRLPKYAEQLGNLTKVARKQFREIKKQVAEEAGSELDEIDWKSLDPRQYDPRRIVREALVEDQQTTARVNRAARAAMGPAAAGGALPVAGATLAGGALATANGTTDDAEVEVPAPFDVEAT